MDRPTRRLRLAEWRDAFALSQRSLADYAGLDRKTIIRLETTAAPPRQETVRKIAGVFRVAPLKLYAAPRPEDIGLAVPARVVPPKAKPAAKRSPSRP